MKKLIIALTTLMAFAFVANAQKCTQYEKGQVVKSSMKTWFCMKTMMPDWAKMKPADKAKFAEEFNKNAESGAEKPSYEGSFETSVKDVSNDNIGELVTLSTIMNGVDYPAYTLCKNDTMFFFRGDKRIIYNIDKGDTVGHTILGVQAIPVKLKVGDVLPMYEDYGTVLSKGKQWTTTISQIAGYKLGKESAFGAKGEWGVGFRESEAVWEEIAVKVNMESQFVMQTKYYVNANVTKEEDVTIDGKTYHTFVIESQKWVKSGTQAVITSDNKQWDKTYEKVSKKISKKAMKEIVKMGLQNEQGYAVTYMTEWFVPGIGVVKSQGYDLNGILTQRTSWDGLK